MKDDEKLTEGDEVEKTGGEYTFRGLVVGVIRKRSGAVRYVVEDDRGLLFIFRPEQLRLVYGEAQAEG